MPEPVTKEPTIDRSFDQTAIHVHDRERICPTCLQEIYPETPGLFEKEGTAETTERKAA